MTAFLIKCPFCGEGELIKTIQEKMTRMKLVSLDENKQLDLHQIPHVDVSIYRCDRCGFLSMFGPDILATPANKQ